MRKTGGGAMMAPSNIDLLPHLKVVAPSQPSQKNYIKTTSYGRDGAHGY